MCAAGPHCPAVRFAMIIFRKKLSEVSETSLARFLSRARKAAGLEGRVQVLVTTSAEMQELNRRFRRKNKPTDVLSFPALAELDGRNAGDIAISADIASANAKQLGHSLSDELKVLVLHGVLHLAGHDHERDNGDMAALEARLRQELRLPGSLTERAAAPAKTRRRGVRA